MKILALLSLAACAIPASAQRTHLTQPDTVVSQFEARLAAFTLNPADTLTTSAKKVCRRGYAGSVRNVSRSEKRAVYARDKATPKLHKCCEVDHRISLELGGSNALSNLWAQPYPEAYQKDSVENWLHRHVCAGDISLALAQRWIASDWRQPYKAMHADR